jgi:hypothetical protein
MKLMSGVNGASEAVAYDAQPPPPMRTDMFASKGGAIVPGSASDAGGGLAWAAVPDGGAGVALAADPFV